MTTPVSRSTRSAAPSAAPVAASGPGTGRRRAAPGRGDRRRIEWRRLPGRIILAVCFLVGAGALAVTVLPFATTTGDGLDLRCGPAVFEAIMPPDPVFDDLPENVGCFDPARTRLLVAGAVLAVVLVVVAVTEWRTRRGSRRRDARWLARPTSGAARRRAARRPPPATPPAVGAAAPPARRR